MCFIDLEKAFDRVQPEEKLQILYNRHITQNIRTTENINEVNTIKNNQPRIDPKHRS